MVPTNFNAGCFSHQTSAPTNGKFQWAASGFRTAHFGRKLWLSCTHSHASSSWIWPSSLVLPVGECWGKSLACSRGSIPTQNKEFTEFYHRQTHSTGAGRAGVLAKRWLCTIDDNFVIIIWFHLGLFKTGDLNNAHWERREPHTRRAWFSKERKWEVMEGLWPGTEGSVWAGLEVGVRQEAVVPTPH